MGYNSDDRNMDGQKRIKRDIGKAAKGFYVGDSMGDKEK